jgi:hypothetical protein
MTLYKNGILCHDVIFIACLLCKISQHYSQCLCLLVGIFLLWWLQWEVNTLRINIPPFSSNPIIASPSCLLNKFQAGTIPWQVNHIGAAQVLWGNSRGTVCKLSNQIIANLFSDFSWCSDCWFLFRIFPIWCIAVFCCTVKYKCSDKFHLKT